MRLGGYPRRQGSERGDKPGMAKGGGIPETPPRIENFGKSLKLEKFLTKIIFGHKLNLN